MSTQRWFALPELEALFALNPDGRLLLLTRALRLFAFGFLSVILVLYFAELGWSEAQIGRLLALTMIGDAILSLWITLVADRTGRARMLRLSAVLMAMVGVLLPSTRNELLLALTVFIGAISLNGGEVGPFLAIEQASLTERVPARHRTTVLAWYALFGALATALGALASGLLSTYLQSITLTPLASYRTIIRIYGVLGILLFALFRLLSPAIEARSTQASAVEPGEGLSLRHALAQRFGLHRSRSIVYRLSLLFMLDTFGSGLVVQSFLAYWLNLQFNLNTAWLGTLFFGVNLLAGLSALVAGRLAARVGLINTMVWTHIPANCLLILLPIMPTLPLVMLILLMRGAISQMDVPARQSYLMAVVDPDERSAAGGVTGIARSIASAAAPPVTGVLLAGGWWSVPFFLAGGLKILYDLTLYYSFRKVKPQH